MKKAGNKLIIVIIVVAIGVGIIALVGIDITGQKGSGLGSQFEYDLSQLREIDPSLYICREEAEIINTGMTVPRSIGVGKEGKIYVAGDKAVFIFDSGGEKISQIELNESVYCLGITDEGSLYLGMKNYVQVYDAEGTFKGQWDKLGAKAKFTSIAVSEEDVFVADAGNRVVLRYDRGGQLLNRIGKKDADRNIAGLVIPSPYFDLAVAGDGLLRVANTGRHRIEAYTFKGDLEFYWGEFSNEIEGFCGCCNPVNFALLPGGGFVTCEKGLTRVKIYDSEGEFAGVVAGPEQFAEHDLKCGDKGADSGTSGLDVAVDSKGKIFVLDPSTGQIRIFRRVENNQ